VWNTAVLIACAIGCIENMLGAQGSSDFNHVHYATLPQRDDEGHARADSEADADAEATETTPLIRPILRTKDESGAIGWWILQFILAVSVPVTLVAHIAVLFLGATAQTLVDGSSPVTVYAGVSILVFMMVLPVIPFTFKIHSDIANLFIIVFVLSTAYNLLAFPFSQAEPLKLFFQQTIDLGNISSPHPEITHATTTLTGVNHYMKDLIVPKLPSAIDQNVDCSYKTPFARQIGLQTCRWESTLLPSPNRASPAVEAPRADYYMTAVVTRLAANSARFTFRAPNTRGCRLYFDNKHITRHNVLGSEGGMLPQFPAPSQGINELHLWSRKWDRTFSVDVEWEGDAALEGRVACEWAEYESGSVGVDAPTGKIPAFEEALSFFPSWAAITKGADGLVEAYGTFSI